MAASVQVICLFAAAAKWGPLSPSRVRLARHAAGIIRDLGCPRPGKGNEASLAQPRVRLGEMEFFPPSENAVQPHDPFGAAAKDVAVVITSLEGLLLLPRAALLPTAPFSSPRRPVYPPSFLPLPISRARELSFHSFPLPSHLRPRPLVYTQHPSSSALFRLTAGLRLLPLGPRCLPPVSAFHVAASALPDAARDCVIPAAAVLWRDEEEQAGNFAPILLCDFCSLPRLWRPTTLLSVPDLRNASVHRCA